MKLKNKFNFFMPLLSFSVFISSLGQKSFALDLTIDLPLDAGKNPVIYYVTKQNQKTDAKQRDSDQAGLPNPLNLPENEAKSQATPFPAALTPQTAVTTWHTHFPELACLKENVSFWEKVYSDIDLNEGIVHDRNNLGRIYAVISIPTGKRGKTLFLKREKEAIESQLMSLANKIRSHKTLNLKEKALAKLFSRSELNDASLKEAAKNVRIQTGLKSQFRAGVQRSINYMSAIFPIVKKSGMPIELVYLPHVESSYNSRAGSKVGALGLWQLMPSTMRLLEGREAIYKRTDPIFSTRAAMKLLKLNYEKTGSWPLALTAYNYGANGIVRAMEETQSKDLCKIIEHYNSPSFKFASSNFYAQFIAARKVAMGEYKVLALKQRNSAIKQNLLIATSGAIR